ncbi:protein kinase [Okeania sp. KiyG1]|uniref:serine/threonine protein kinase n=1 Tax=Okeania sp. KiyG1 TaxID=2720165 RepID=UPI001924AB56|nr:protein kinase [Okeania sp. KiyG1]GGA46307.1 hypothetical protein CYANOKiyG1_65320 [Okeania sp. KiyG1]
MSKSKRKPKPWDENWNTIKDIGGGGHGLTFLVEPKNDLFSVGQYVLKRLKNQESLERRSRMHVEVTIIGRLNILNCPNIPKLIDSNSQYFKDKNVPLYMVTEFIEGKTLEKFITEKGIVDVFDAIKLTFNLLETLELCHQEGIVHRDIKPDNIIVRNDSLTTPVLIDFGLSFNKENDTSLTPTEQDVGNRFLVLPEHRRKSGLQRDPRSDITQICGILFFLITGEPPYLFDAKGSKPHQNQKVKQKLLALPEQILSRINRVFDTAFDIRIDYRWQSTITLNTALIDVLNSENQEYNEKTSLDEIRHKASTDTDKELFENVARKILKKFMILFLS